MSLVLTTAPTIEPVGIEELKDHLHITNDLEDTYLEGLAISARRIIESFLRRALMTQTWDLWLDAHQVPATDYLEIPLPPLASVTHLKSYSTDGTESTFSSSKYDVDTGSSPGRICLKTGYTWPSSLRSRKSIDVQFVAGWTTDSLVPEPIRHGIKLFVARLYQQRQWDAGVTIFHCPAEVYQMISSWRIYHL